ncbi:MaoC family dehydratase N-terminal domain-containing protein [Streptomyces sp. NPDC056486]|uniref:MaoC family dehydratase N-terminal domain-containing protein n=1 Tax=Streptomyces sp. NPDC056486 TaxID=3345835 RepID=UPI0036795147
MSIPATAIGTRPQPVTLLVERGRLRSFARAIGECDPVYTDLAAARAAGHPDLPVPPTFLFGVELEQPDPFAYLTELGVDLRQVLHGEQSFTYHAIAHAGDTLTARPEIIDVLSKKGGALDLLVKETTVTRSDGSPVAELRSVTVVRNESATGVRNEVNAR